MRVQAEEETDERWYSVSVDSGPEPGQTQVGLLRGLLNRPVCRTQMCTLIRRTQAVFCAYMIPPVDFVSMEFGIACLRLLRGTQSCSLCLPCPAMALPRSPAHCYLNRANYRTASRSVGLPVVYFTDWADELAPKHAHRTRPSVYWNSAEFHALLMRPLTDPHPTTSLWQHQVVDGGQLEEVEERGEESHVDAQEATHLDNELGLKSATPEWPRCGLVWKAGGTAEYH